MSIGSWVYVLGSYCGSIDNTNIYDAFFPKTHVDDLILKSKTNILMRRPRLVPIIYWLSCLFLFCSWFPSSSIHCIFIYHMLSCSLRFDLHVLIVLHHQTSKIIRSWTDQLIKKPLTYPHYLWIRVILADTLRYIMHLRY